MSGPDLHQASEVAHGLDTGRLWVGPAGAAIPVGVTLIVTLAPENEPAEGIDEHVWHFDDSRWVPVEGVGLATAVARVVDALEAGNDVLVRCRSGFNRSGLVAGCALHELGLDGDRAVHAIRAARAGRALDNPYFRDVVLAWPADPMTGTDLSDVCPEGTRR